jgi:prepilin-type N-terminal cleavage/methylation domain-containing protein
MTTSKGFTMIEILVVLIIIGLGAAFIIPNLTTSVELSRAQTAKQNLLAISASQQKYFEDNGAYCVGALGAGTNALYACLRLQTSDSFTYTCVAAGGNIPYNCTATDGTDTLSLNPNNSPSITCAPVGGMCF